MKQIKLLFIIFFAISKQVSAQYYLTGVESFSTSWKQIKTNQFRIVFPSDAEKMAIRYANLLSIIDTAAPKSLQANQKKFDVVMHNHSVLSNGFVAWAPKRMEIITNQPTSTYSQNWLTQLALHETRHTSQLFKLNTGIIKPLSFVFGEQVTGISAGFVPSWFLEGDAVAFETATSNTGRGRQADFYQYYRAHYLSKTKKFSYDKWLMGSYKDKIPDHYSLGYQLVAYGKFKYGDKLWSNTLSYVSKYPFTIFPFYFGLKKESGLSRKQLYGKAFSNLDSLWRSDWRKENNKEIKILTRENKEYTDYLYPHLLNDSILFALRKNLSEIASFVQINTNTQHEETLIIPGYLTSKPSYFKDNIYWTEYKPNERWEYRNYSIIKTYNTTTQITRILSNRGRYFSPVYNPFDGLVYSISVNDDGTSDILAFHNNSKTIAKEIKLPEYYQPFELVISNSSNIIYVGVVTEKGKAIITIDEKGYIKLVLGPTYQDIHSVFAFDENIVFATTDGLVENVFLCKQKNNRVFRLTKSNYGSTDPMYYSKINKVVCSEFTPNGYSISIMDFDTTDQIQPSFNKLGDQITKQLTNLEKFNIDSISIPERNYEVQPYGGLKTLLNIHSWAPFFYNPYQLTAIDFLVKPGVTVLSQNLTGSSVLVAGYGYDRSNLVHINYQYLGFYPVVSVTFDIENHQPSVYAFRNTIYPSTSDKRKEGRLSLYIPFKLSANRFHTSLYPFFQIINSNDFLFSTKDSAYHKGLNRLNYSIYFSRLQSLAIKDIRSRLGVEARFGFEHAPLNANNLGSLVYGDINLYLPGLARNHSFLVKIIEQKQELKNFYLPNKIIFPRGYLAERSEKIKAISFDYLFPIAYPDFSLGSLVYIKRISVNPYFDYAENSYPARKSGVLYTQQDYLRSTGVELFLDVHFFRTKYPFRLKFTQGWVGSRFSPFNDFGVSIDFYNQ